MFPAIEGILALQVLLAAAIICHVQTEALKGKATPTAGPSVAEVGSDSVRGVAKDMEGVAKDMEGVANEKELQRLRELLKQRDDEISILDSGLFGAYQP